MRIRHIIKEDDGIVVAVAVFNKMTVTDSFIEADKMSAIAKCHPEDKFDKDKGIAIANDRLMEKYYRAQKKELEKYCDMLDLMLTQATKLQATAVEQHAIFEARVQEHRDMCNCSK